MTPPFATLHKIKPREKSGARTSSRFEFQANFSILKILDLHEAGSDYRVLLDHSDDLTILDSSDNPTRIQFYQIKGRDSGQRWTIKQLVKEEKGGASPRSVIGKMYQNAANFPAEAELTAFASNASYNFLLKDGTKTTPDNAIIKGIDLHGDEVQAIDAILEPDFPSPRNPACIGILLFERTNLPLQQQATFVTGRLAEYLAKLAGGDKFPIKALYDVLLQNVKARAGNTEEPDSLSKFYQTKSISRAEIDALIERASTKRNLEASWPLIANELAAAKYSLIQIIQIQNASFRYLRERARGDRLPNEFSEEIKAIIAAQKSSLDACASIVDAVNLLKAQQIKVQSYTGNDLFGALLVEAYEAIDGKA